MLKYLFANIFFISSVIFSIEVPLKQLVKISTLRENRISGYGIVAGLSGTGDKRDALASETLERVLKLRGVEVDRKSRQNGNIAAVLVTASIPPFMKPGDKLNIWVTSIGDARSLAGGFLLETPLMSGDGGIYAVAQGSLITSAENKKGSRSNNVSNTIMLPAGAIAEKNISQPIFTVEEQKTSTIRLSLIEFDYVTLRSIIRAIEKKFPGVASYDEKNSQILLHSEDATKFPDTAADILNLPVEVQAASRVVIDPRSGTIVMGGNISVSQIAVSKDGIMVKVDQKSDKAGSVYLLNDSVTVNELVGALNISGVSTSDIIDILKAVHAAGALHAELIIL